MMPRVLKWSIVAATILVTLAAAADVTGRNLRGNGRYPVWGASLQRRGGTARHDAVAWGYARGADQRGVDIIQNCQVTGFLIENGQVRGVETTRGTISAPKIGVVTAGHSGVMAEMAGLKLPVSPVLPTLFFFW